MTEILIATLVIALMASLAVNGYLLGYLRAERFVPVDAEISEKKPQPQAANPGVPRFTREHIAFVQDEKKPAGMSRKIVSPSEAISRAQQKRDGLVTETPQIPAATRKAFLEDAGAVVASPAKELEAA